MSERQPSVLYFSSQLWHFSLLKKESVPCHEPDSIPIPFEFLYLTFCYLLHILHKYIFHTALQNNTQLFERAVQCHKHLTDLLHSRILPHKAETDHQAPQHTKGTGQHDIVILLYTLKNRLVRRTLRHLKYRNRIGKSAVLVQL